MHVFALCADELGIVTIHIITPPRGGSDFFYRHPDPDFIHPLECCCDCLVSPSKKSTLPTSFYPAGGVTICVTYNSERMHDLMIGVPRIARTW